MTVFGMETCGKHGPYRARCTYLVGHKFDCYDAHIGVAFNPRRHPQPKG